VKPNSSPATLLFVHGSNDLYGADVVLLELLKRLDRRQFEPFVILPRDAQHINRLSQRLDEERISYRFIRMAVIRRKYFSPFGLLTFALNFLVGVVALMYIIWRLRAVLVHSNTMAVPCGALAARLMGRPSIWHIHEIVTRPAWARRLLHPVAVALSTQVVAVSQAVQAHILADCPSAPHKIRVIHNGVNVAGFDRPGNGEEIRSQYRIPESAVLVGMIGKVCRWKGQLLFVEAAKLVTRERPEVRFLAVGGVFDDEVHFMNHFREAAAEAGLADTFVIADYRSDVPDVLRSLDLFILPSTEPDPFPTVVLEAMAAAKPVIACHHGGAPEMVIEGETGLLFPPGCAEPLAAAILRLVDDRILARRMGEAGRKRAYAHFQATRYVADFQALYGECLSHAGGHLNGLDDQRGPAQHNLISPDSGGPAMSFREAGKPE
jgi:glycosyltransferase involved in cell wall biosynthesis